MKAHQLPIGKNDEWLTPPWILNALGEFTLDPCSPVVRPWSTAGKHYTEEEDGLNKDWFGRVWCNPPFQRYNRPKWMKRMSEHNNGIMLIPAACETKAFADYVWGRCSGLLFLDRRPHYYYVDGTEAKMNSGCTMVLISYGEHNLEILRGSSLGYVCIEG